MNLVGTEFFCHFGGRDQIQIVQCMIRRSSLSASATLTQSKDYLPFQKASGGGEDFSAGSHLAHMGCVTD